VADLPISVPTRASAFEPNGPRALIRIDGNGVDRDLLITGFNTEDEAANFAWAVAEMLQRLPCWQDYSIGWLAYASRKEQVQADARAANRTLKHERNP
jgi:hypothetical protein